jgi:hypothetical protein
MEGRQLLANASYDPHQVRALGKGFDDAWDLLAPSVSSQPEAIEAARFALADVILGLAKHGNFDPQWLADNAVGLMLSRTSGSRP